MCRTVNAVDHCTAAHFARLVAIESPTFLKSGRNPSAALSSRNGGDVRLAAGQIDDTMLLSPKVLATVRSRVSFVFEQHDRNRRSEIATLLRCLERSLTLVRSRTRDSRAKARLRSLIRRTM